MTDINITILNYIYYDRVHYLILLNYIIAYYVLLFVYLGHLPEKTSWAVLKKFC